MKLGGVTAKIEPGFKAQRSPEIVDSAVQRRFCLSSKGISLHAAAMMIYLLIGLGGALGSMARYGLSSLMAGPTGETFPWSTLLINVIGSFIIGFFSTLTGPEGRIPASRENRLFVMTGLCGGFTTFSAFSLQTLNLARDGDWLRAGGNVAGSVVICLVAVWLGHLTATAINTSR